MKRCLVIWMIIQSNIAAMAQIPKVSSGSIRHFENFPSRYVAARNVDVWLPDGYSATKKYAVLYMHDGKSLFDSSIVWNHQEWGVDEVLGKLLVENKIRDCIVVGAWNTELTRHNEYLPQKPYESLNKDQQQVLLRAKRTSGNDVFSSYEIRSDDYLRFLVRELKPYIDSAFSTLPNQQHTFISGSSMGGLISIYAICEYPGVFGGAACLSTHWTGIFRKENNPFPGAMISYLEKKLPSPGNHKIYFDLGTETIDSLYSSYQLRVDRKMKNRGFNKMNWVTKEYPGADHSERSWNKRLEIPMNFLLKK